MDALIRQTFLHSDAGASQGGWRGCKDSAWLATRKSQRRHGWGKGGDWRWNASLCTEVLCIEYYTE